MHTILGFGTEYGQCVRLREILWGFRRWECGQNSEALGPTLRRLPYFKRMATPRSTARTRERRAIRKLRQSYTVADDRMVSKLGDVCESCYAAPGGFCVQTFRPKLVRPEKMCSPNVIAKMDRLGRISPVIQKSQISSCSPVSPSLMESGSEGSGSGGRGYGIGEAG